MFELKFTCILLMLAVHLQIGPLLKMSGRRCVVQFECGHHLSANAETTRTNGKSTRPGVFKEAKNRSACSHEHRISGRLFQRFDFRNNTR